MLFGSAGPSRSDRLVRVYLILNWLVRSYQLKSDSDSWPLVDRLLLAYFRAPCWIFDLSLALLTCWSSLFQSTSFLSVASSDSLDFAVSAYPIRPVFDFPSATIRLAPFYLVSCRSPIMFLSAMKRCFRSGFIRQSMMFTSMLIFWTSSFFLVTSSRIWWYRTSMCFICAWKTGFRIMCIALCES